MTPASAKVTRGSDSDALTIPGETVLLAAFAERSIGSRDPARKIDRHSRRHLVLLNSGQLAGDALGESDDATQRFEPRLRGATEDQCGRTRPWVKHNERVPVRVGLCVCHCDFEKRSGSVIRMS